MIRYVNGEGVFGYAEFGTFFFDYGQMYILKNIPNYTLKGDRSDEIFDIYFCNYMNDPMLAWNCCVPVLYAGVRTVNKDIDGDWIFVGDIVEKVDDDLNWGGVGANSGDFPEKWGPQYDIIGDNCSQHLHDVGVVKRLGTIFYQLPKGEPFINIEGKCMSLHCQGAITKEEVLMMAKFTPSYDLEYWKYSGKEILGVEPTWNK